MTEQSAERPIEAKTERFEDEQKLSQLLMTLKEKADELSIPQFKTVEEAQTAINQFDTELQVMLREAGPITQIPLILSGEGVSVPNMRYANDTVEGNSNTISIILDAEMPYRELSVFESVVGNFNGVHVRLLQEEEDDLLGVGMYFTARLNDPESVALTLEDSSAHPAIHAVVTRMARVELTDRSQVAIEKLLMYEAKKELVAELAKHGMTNTLFKRQLNRLEQALFTEDPKAFTNLTKLDIVYRLGELGEMHAREGQMQSDMVSKAILETLGNGRPVNVTYSLPLLGESGKEVSTKGLVVDILMPSSDEDDRMATLVLDGLNDEGDPAMHYIELHRLQVLRF